MLGLLLLSASAFQPAFVTHATHMAAATPISRPVVMRSDASLAPTPLRRVQQEDSSVLVHMAVAGPPKIIICGAPASGKGTQCELLKETYGVVHLSTGDMLRAAVADKTEVGMEAKGFMERGELVPDEVIIGIVKDRLAESDCKENGWLLDGFPRTEAQAKALESAGITPNKVLFLNVPDEMLIERVVGRRTDPETGKIYHMTFSPPESEEIAARLTQRSDDTEEKVKVRLEAFHEHMTSVEKCYSDLISYTDGTKAKDEVFASLQACLTEFA
jgi:adenylate kinase